MAASPLAQEAASHVEASLPDHACRGGACEEEVIQGRRGDPHLVHRGEEDHQVRVETFRGAAFLRARGAFHQEACSGEDG